VSDVSTRPVLQVRSLDPKAVCHRPPNFQPGLRPWSESVFTKY